jgi:capsular polysaccharide biosynthesis protein
MQENNIGFGNNYDHEATRLFFRRWWKVLVAVFVVAAVASAIAAWMIKPLYKSSAVIFPTNSNRLSKAIMDYHYSLDFMDYGIERDCEYAIQILSSKRMQQAVCDHFKLMEHYGIPSDDPHRMFKLETQYRSNISVKRTEFLGVEIGVLDQDPQWAADIANYIATMYDTLCREIHHDRAVGAAEVMEGVCLSMEREIDSLSQLPATPWRTKLIADKCEQLADLQTRATQTEVDKNLSVSYKYSVDEAVPADKKAYPKRLLIILGGSFGAVVVAIFALLVFCPGKKEED